jgi:ankyrin repeat protein
MHNRHDRDIRMDDNGRTMKKPIALILCLVLFECNSQKPASKIVVRDIFEATKYGELERVKSLVQSDPKLVTSTSPENGMWPLAFAAANDRIQIAEFLLNQGANIEQTGEYGTALHDAADAGHLEMVKLLLAKGANVNSQANNWKRSPLDMAATSRDQSKECVEVLLSHKANVKLTDSLGRTPLHRVNDQEVARLLLRAGIDINARDQNGSTWLHWAASSRVMYSLSMVEFMLSNGANPKLKDNSGKTAAQIARQFKKPDLAILLEKTK